MFKTRPLRSVTPHKVCSLMMFGSHLISFMASSHRIGNWKPVAIKTIFLPQKQNNGGLSVRWFSFWAVLSFKKTQGVALNNSNSTRMIWMKCLAANLWLCMTRAIFYSTAASPAFINSVIFRNSDPGNLCAYLSPHAVSSRLIGPFVTPSTRNLSGSRPIRGEDACHVTCVDQSEPSTRPAANEGPGLAMTGAGPGRSRLSLEMLHPYAAWRHRARLNLSKHCIIGSRNHL